mgnify:CR=1 FL=1
MFFLLLFSFFFYFGSGQGAESAIAILSEKIATLIIILLPILFNLYKIVQYSKTNQLLKANSYILAALILILFFCCLFYIDFIGS